MRVFAFTLMFAFANHTFSASLSNTQKLIQAINDSQSDNPPKIEDVLSYIGDERDPANINVRGNRGTTILMVAASSTLPVVLELLARGANVLLANKENVTPLFFAVMHNNILVTQALLDRGANIHRLDENKKNSALAIAAMNGNAAMVKLLIANGADVNHRNKNGKTPMYYAVKYDHLNVAKVLFHHDANITERDNLGRTWLIVAVSNGNTDVFLWLLEKAQREPAIFSDFVDAVDSLDCTALMYSAMEGYLHFIIFLMQNGANIHGSTSTEGTALDVAITYKEYSAAALLISCGVGCIFEHGNTHHLLPFTNIRKKNPMRMQAALDFAVDEKDLELLKAILFLNVKHSETLPEVAQRLHLNDALQMLTDDDLM